MAAGLLTISLNTINDLPEAKFDEFPEQFTSIVQELIEKFQRQLGPDAGRPGTITLNTITFT
jgi:hypothetical protein